jgi:YVTN family beta-propeller protein
MLAACAMMLPVLATAAEFKVVNKFRIEGGGRWDYLYIDGTARRIYMARATHFSVLDADSGGQVGDIPDTPGAHGVTLVPGLGLGFTTNGQENKVSVFDVKTLKVITKIETGQNPDSILFHPATGKLFVQNGKSNTSSVIDPEKKQVIATIPLPGKPEFAVYDDSGNIFINIETSGSIVVIDAANQKVKTTWAMKGCEEPAGLAIDRAHHRLFSACANKMMAIVDSDNGTLVQTLPIGEDCDAVAFDPSTGYTFASNGDGTLTIIHSEDGKYSVKQTLTIGDGAKTMGFDAEKHRAYLPTAKFTGPPTSHPRPSVVPGSISVVVIGE